MKTVGIMGNGPKHLLPDLSPYKDAIDVWIGADAGTQTLINNHMQVTYAVGDFDSMDEQGLHKVKENVETFIQYPEEKDKTDIEIALLKALELNPAAVILFGVTGGRLDHELINIQLLLKLARRGIRGVIIDQSNKVEVTLPKTHIVKNCEKYPYISFIPFSEHVKGLTLSGFYYPLVNKNISWGSSLCISNKLLSNNGTFYYKEGILLLIKSRDAQSNTIPL